MTNPEVVAPPRRNRNGACLGGCCGCLLLLVIGAVAFAVTGMHAATEALIKAGLEHAAPGSKWTVRTPPLAAAKWMLGQPSDLHAESANITLENVTISRLVFDAVGLQLDSDKLKTGTNPIKGAQEARFAVSVDGQALTQAIRQASKNDPAKDMSVKLEGGKVIFHAAKREGDTERAVNLTCTPKVEPPAKLVFVLDKVDVDVKGDEEKARVENAVRSGFGKDGLAIDLTEGGKAPVTLKSATVNNGLLELVGNVDPKVLGQESKSSEPAKDQGT